MALNLLVSLFGRLVARSGRISGTGQTDGRNDRLTLAAHACRGLIISISMLLNMFQFYLLMYSSCTTSVWQRWTIICKVGDDDANCHLLLGM